MSPITEVAVQQINAKHVIVFFRSNDDVNALEFGEPEHVKTAQEEAEAKTGGHHAPAPHGQQKKHHSHSEQHSHDAGAYKIHAWVPVSQRSPAPKLPTQWTAVSKKGKLADEVAREVKHGITHHAAHGADAAAFTKFVLEEVFGVHN